MLALLLACHGPGAEPSALDLTTVLSADQARAGVVTDETALFGGVSAEGQAGDVKIYNNRAQFVIQGVRDGDYYLSYGGGLLDADRVRTDGSAGRDLLDEASPMAGLGRVMKAEQVRVVNDGRFGGPAIVRAEGPGAPFLLATGALESPDLVPDRDVWIQTDYILAPDTPLLKMVTTVTWRDSASSVLLGDLFLIGLDVAEPWQPGRGLGGGAAETTPWMGIVGWKDEVAFGVFSSGAEFERSAAVDTLEELAPVIAALIGSEPMEEGQQVTWARYVGVGGALSELAAAWYTAEGVETETLSGEVIAQGQPVAGARVHLLNSDGDPVGLARTDEQGLWRASLPSGEAVSAVATGRGHAIFVDHPEGAGWYPPYGAAPVQAEALRSLAEGATPVPFAEGYGVSEPAALSPSAPATLQLHTPAFLHVDTGDGLPATVRVSFATSDPVPEDDALYPDRPGGLAALAFLRDGEGLIPVETGPYHVVVHRGPRWEISSEDLSVLSGQTVEVSAALAESWSRPGVFALDPHSHAAPSSDSDLAMEDRLVVHAAQGVDVHFGTDHDHVSDYRPLLAPLGLSDVLASVVADEVSPVLRGHFNAYPLVTAPELPNNGALPWWEDVVSTDTLFSRIRARAPEGALVQVNHPEGSSGMFGQAGYDLGSGSVSDPDRFSEDFDAIEVLNSDDYDEYLPFYLDILNRGLNPTPVGVTDAHGHRNNVGASLTWAHLGLDGVADFTPEALIATMGARATVPSRGPFIEATLDGAWAPGQTVVGAQTLEVTVWAPSWMPVDTLSLLRDGAVVETVAASGAAPAWIQASFSLDPAEDASYVLIAEGATGMDEVYPGVTPWAMTAAIRLDVEGDGWTPPWPAITR